jgi:hypothetical protein
MGEYTRSGVIGRSSLGTGEKGKAVLASLTESFSPVLDILLRALRPLPRCAAESGSQPSPSHRGYRDGIDTDFGY